MAIALEEDYDMQEKNLIDEYQMDLEDAVDLVLDYSSGHISFSSVYASVSDLGSKQDTKDLLDEAAEEKGFTKFFYREEGSTEIVYSSEDLLEDGSGLH